MLHISSCHCQAQEQHRKLCSAGTAQNSQHARHAPDFDTCVTRNGPAQSVWKQLLLLVQIYVLAHAVCHEEAGVILAPCQL